VDRFRVRADAAQRLAESFETALGLSGIGARADRPTTAATKPGEDCCSRVLDLRASCLPATAATACRRWSRGCSRSTVPAGACPSCDGLGVQQFFDPERIVQHPRLSLAGGAIRGWDRRNVYYFQMIQSLAKHLRFRHRTALRQICPSGRESACSTAAARKPSFQLPERARQRAPSASTLFEGIVPNLERRYRETESATVREELAKYHRHARAARPARARG
jgi:excinuclease ABC subunit A